MTSPEGPARPSAPSRSGFAKRYGPLVAILAVVGVVVALTVLGGGDDSTEDESAEREAGKADIPITYPEAEEAGTVDDYDWGENCDPETGRIRMPSIFAPPCVPVWPEGEDNGGETGTGVTADTIKVVNYVPPEGGDLAGALQGLLDTAEDARATQEGYLEMLSSLYETYGRKVEIIDFKASGTDDVAARADGRKVATEIRPFASFGGPALSQGYAEELAAEGILCFGCGVSAPGSKYLELAPHMWGAQANPEQYILILGNFVVNRLLGRPAEFAGDDLKDKERVFGVIHFEQDPPVFGDVRTAVQECGAAQGYEAALTETYTLDLAKAPERSATIIAKMKDAGVTTIIFLGDPLYPRFLTQAATAEDYFPEWVVTGTVLTDTTVFGRSYDPEQWKHAFGLSSLPTPTDRTVRDSWRLYEWYFGTPPPAQNTNALIFPGVSLLLQGIQMAGPDLNPDTFEAGLFNLPPIGGGPTTPQISFGDHDFFDSTECDRDGDLDYVGIDDMTEIWWDPEAVGPDEQGNEGKGMWRYARGGTRYLPGEMPEENTYAFDPEGAITGYGPDEIPDEDLWPEYPSPAGSPAAAGSSPRG